jgi:hypothetical protein
MWTRAKVPGLSEPSAVGADPRHLPLDRAVPEGIDAQRDGVADLDRGGEALGDFGEHAQRLQPDDAHHRALDPHELSDRDEALRDDPVERRADGGVLQLAVGEAQRGLALGNFRLQLPCGGLELRFRFLELLLGHQVAAGELARPREPLFGFGKLGGGADHVGRFIQGRQLAALRAVASARLFEGGARFRGAIAEFFGVEDDQRITRPHVIAHIGSQTRDAGFHLGAHDRFIARGQRPDGLDRPPNLHLLDPAGSHLEDRILARALTACRPAAPGRRGRGHQERGDGCSRQSECRARVVHRSTVDPHPVPRSSVPCRPARPFSVPEAPCPAVLPVVGTTPSFDRRSRVKARREWQWRATGGRDRHGAEPVWRQSLSSVITSSPLVHLPGRSGKFRSASRAVKDRPRWATLSIFVLYTPRSDH